MKHFLSFIVNLWSSSIWVENHLSFPVRGINLQMLGDVSGSSWWLCRCRKVKKPRAVCTGPERGSPNVFIICQRVWFLNDGRRLTSAVTCGSWERMSEHRGSAFARLSYLCRCGRSEWVLQWCVALVSPPTYTLHHSGGGGVTKRCKSDEMYDSGWWAYTALIS